MSRRLFAVLTTVSRCLCPFQLETRVNWVALTPRPLSVLRHHSRRHHTNNSSSNNNSSNNPSSTRLYPRGITTTTPLVVYSIAATPTNQHCSRWDVSCDMGHTHLSLV